MIFSTSQVPAASGAAASVAASAAASTLLLADVAASCTRTSTSCTPPHLYHQDRSVTPSAAHASWQDASTQWPPVVRSS
jgi:hypothetical protein